MKADGELRAGTAQVWVAPGGGAAPEKEIREDSSLEAEWTRPRAFCTQRTVQNVWSKEPAVVTTPTLPTWSQVSGRDEANSQYRPVYTAYLTCSFQN